MANDALLREAEELGVPWREILEAEIQAESTLRKLLADLDRDWRLDVVLPLLPRALGSWRVRARIERLRWEARPGSGNGVEARRELRNLDRHLRGRSERPPSSALRGSRLLFAYRRVTELLVLCRIAAKARRAAGDGVERVRAQSKCGLEDACLGLDRLIHVKRAAGRPKDLEVIAELEALREERDRAR